MKHIICAVKDTAAQTFGRLFPVAHGNAAIRSFSDEVNRASTQQEQNDLFSHPDDFELYELGHYDDQLGAIVPHDDGPRLLVRGKDVTQRTDTKPSPRVVLNGGSDTKSVNL